MRRPIRAEEVSAQALRQSEARGPSGQNGGPSGCERGDPGERGEREVQRGCRAVRDPREASPPPTSWPGLLDFLISLGQGEQTGKKEALALPQRPFPSPPGLTTRPHFCLPGSGVEPWGRKWVPSFKFLFPLFQAFSACAGSVSLALGSIHSCLQWTYAFDVRPLLPTHTAGTGDSGLEDTAERRRLKVPGLRATPCGSPSPLGPPRLVAAKRVST